MLPGAAAGAVGAAGRAVMNLRAAARANIVLGLAMAAIALVAATTNPGDLFRAQAQILEHAAQAPAPEAQQCASTEADALSLRGLALPLVLTGIGQVVVAVAADVAVVGSLQLVGGWLAAVAYFIGFLNAWQFCDVVHAAAVVANGQCAGQYHTDFVIGYVVVGVSYAALLGVTLAAACC